MLDEKFTNSIQSWLNADSESRSLRQGAELLLRLNRNRWMYQQILRTNNFNKIEYELKKHLAIRLAGMTLQDVERMEREVMPKAKESVDNGMPVISTDNDQPKGKYLGKRADHETLPTNIRDLYEKNGEIYFKLKQTFETLKRMNSAAPCDRFEYLQILAELDKKYRENWEKYDSYKPDNQSDQETAVAINLKKLQAARKYLSENRPKLQAALETEDESTAEKLKSKMQKRIDLLISAKQTFSPEYQFQLESLGLSFAKQ